MSAFFDTPIEYLKGVGPQRAALLNKELNIFTFGDLIQHYPFRYEDRTRFYNIQEIHEEMPVVQLKGKIRGKEIIGTGIKKRMVCYFGDETGEVELVWFQGIAWVSDKIKTGIEYVVFGKPVRYGNRYSIAHPEIDLPGAAQEKLGILQPVYPLSEKLRSRKIDSKTISKLIQDLLLIAQDKIRETLPDHVIRAQSFLGKKESVVSIH
jgi:ATP-dependent DNA helicase RecG